uniref:Uncharacterized protein n=1 Tax=Chenopodium quinoa TaxID=63459 RepID=A0A803MWT2_CHEQI
MTERVEHCSVAVTTEDKNVRIFKIPTQHVLLKIYYNPGGDKEYMPGCSLENITFVGMIFDTPEDGIVFYYKYANECGFKVRSSTTKVQKNKDDPTGTTDDNAKNNPENASSSKEVKYADIQDKK